MKISIAWAFDHIEADYRKIDIPALITKLSQTTAEVEGYQIIDLSLDRFSVVTVKSMTNEVYAYSPEWLKNITLPKRADAHENAWYLIVQEDTTYRWATSADLGGYKEMLLPPLQVGEDHQKGGWKKSFEKKDYVIEIENKSINHRPDLWGHRGFAREIAAILNYRLKPIEQFCASIKVINRDNHASASADLPYTMLVENKQLVSRFAGLYMQQVTYTASLLWMVSRLSRIDSRAINAIVDCTNYVMFDITQPMHAFDANKLLQQTIIARQARNKETITLLDDQLIELTDKDIVIADSNRPVSLAGIMGGKESSVRSTTKSLFLEAAHFDASTIRKSSQQHKIRTESSARFEKNLDPNQNIIALQRFIQLLHDAHIAYEGALTIISFGPLLQPPVLKVSLNEIERKLGTSIAPAFVRTTLEKLDFHIQEKQENNDTIYTIIVPTFRATKDIAIPEDIIEEVGRFYGYGNITPQLPYHQTKPTSLHAVMQQYRIKQLMAFGLSMRELYTYAFFDESFLHTIAWDPGKTVQVKDPVSANWYRLVTTLMPNMFKAVAENAATYDQLRFFEWARCWSLRQQIHEKKVLTGIMYEKRTGVHFYDMKAELHKLFIQLGMPVQWQSAQDIAYPWFDKAQTAHLEYNGESLGIAGIVEATFMKQCAEGSAFIFELNADVLGAYEKLIHTFHPLPKYPAIERDVSIMAPLSLTVEELTRLIMSIDDHIRSATLIDMFQKKEWHDQRALTFRYVMRDADKTMTKEQADSIDKKVYEIITQAGATIR